MFECKLLRPLEQRHTLGRVRRWPKHSYLVQEAWVPSKTSYLHGWWRSQTSISLKVKRKYLHNMCMNMYIYMLHIFYITLHGIALHYIILHYITLYIIAWHGMTLHDIYPSMHTYMTFKAIECVYIYIRVFFTCSYIYAYVFLTGSKFDLPNFNVKPQRAWVCSLC